MNADEMFAKLGYFRCEYQRFIYYEDDNKPTIVLDKEYPSVRFMGFVGDVEIKLSAKEITAIKMKLDELEPGWDKDV